MDEEIAAEDRDIDLRSNHSRSPDQEENASEASETERQNDLPPEPDEMEEPRDLSSPENQFLIESPIEENIVREEYILVQQVNEEPELNVDLDLGYTEETEEENIESEQPKVVEEVHQQLEQTEAPAEPMLQSEPIEDHIEGLSVIEEDEALKSEAADIVPEVIKPPMTAITEQPPAAAPTQSKLRTPRVQVPKKGSAAPPGKALQKGAAEAAKMPTSSSARSIRSQSTSRTGLNSPSLKTAPSLPATPKLTQKYSNVRSRIDSKTSHTPTGGNIKIFHEPQRYGVGSRVGSLQNVHHRPGGGNIRVETAKLNFKDEAQPRIDARSAHKPAPSEKKILTQKLQWNVQSKVGSLDNATHTPGGGNVKIFHQKIDINAGSKVGSLDNAAHNPGGGNVKIFHQRVDVAKAGSKVGSLDNAAHQAGGGNVKIFHQKIDLTNAASKVGSMENAAHVPGGGNVKIEDRKLDFSRNARSKIGSTSSISGSATLSRGSSERSMPGAVDPLRAEQILGTI